MRILHAARSVERFFLCAVRVYDDSLLSRALFLQEAPNRCQLAFVSAVLVREGIVWHFAWVGIEARLAGITVGGAGPGKVVVQDVELGEVV